MDDELTAGRRPRLARPVLWVGLALTLLGLAFNLGLFFVPLTEVLADPQFVPLPEVLFGWWVVGVGVVLMGWSQLSRARR